MTRSQQPRRYPRSARVNEVVRETIADEVERLSDPRLGLVTITGVDVSPDLRQAALLALRADRAACRAHAERFSWRACAELFLSHLVSMAAE